MHRRRTKLVVGLTAAVAAMLMLVPTAGAATSCAYTQTSTVFMPWLDLAQYTRFPGSAFESGASGWSWGGGAKIVTGDSNVALAAGSARRPGPRLGHRQVAVGVRERDDAVDAVLRPPRLRFRLAEGQRRA